MEHLKCVCTNAYGHLLRPRPLHGIARSSSFAARLAVYSALLSADLAFERMALGWMGYNCLQMQVAAHSAPAAAPQPDWRGRRPERWPVAAGTLALFAEPRPILEQGHSPNSNFHCHKTANLSPCSYKHFRHDRHTCRRLSSCLRPRSRTSSSRQRPCRPPMSARTPRSLVRSYSAVHRRSCLPSTRRNCPTAQSDWSLDG